MGLFWHLGTELLNGGFLSISISLFFQLAHKNLMESWVCPTITSFCESQMFILFLIYVSLDLSSVFQNSYCQMFLTKQEIFVFGKKVLEEAYRFLHCCTGQVNPIRV